MDKKYLIILAVVAVVGFFVYKWYKGKKAEVPEKKSVGTSEVIKKNIASANEALLKTNTATKKTVPTVKKTVTVAEPTKAQNLVKQAEPKIIDSSVTKKQNIAQTAAQSKGQQLYRTNLVME